MEVLYSFLFFFVVFFFSSIDFIFFAFIHKEDIVLSRQEGRVTPCEGVLGSIPAVAARSLLVCVSLMRPAEIEAMACLPSLSRVGQYIKLSDVSLGTPPRYNLVVDEDVKKPTKQTRRQEIINDQLYFLKILKWNVYIFLI